MADIFNEKTIALRCSLCGKLEHHLLSVFSFSGTHSVRIYCSCCFRKAVINMKDSSCYFIQAPCILCETEHVFSFTAKQLWNSVLEGLVCPESGAELGFFGEISTVKEKAEEWEKSHSGGFDEYFLNPPLMFDVLNHLHRVADSKRLFCHCGNQDIEVDLFPDSLELRCSRCGQASRISAVEEKDRVFIEKVTTIVMNQGGISSEVSMDHPILYRLK